MPSLPFRLPASRNYYGIEEMKQGELDFFKATALSKSAAPVFMCSDMPMADMAEDLDFGKKWMFGIAVALRKGLHLDIIHNIDRPFEEMMLGLESWIPIYMTGQVSPYYLKGVQNTVYCHFHYVSGAAALTGECINGFHEDGHYHFTNNREEVQHSRRIADHLLQKAQPLMEIYKAPQADLFRAFLKNDAATVGARQNILSAPPLYTMPGDSARTHSKAQRHVGSRRRKHQRRTQTANGKYRANSHCKHRHRRAPACKRRSVPGKPPHALAFKRIHRKHRHVHL